MKSPIYYINRSLSLKLCFGILLCVVIVFSLSLGFLYERSRRIVRLEAAAHTEHALDNISRRVTNYIDEVEVATNNIEWLVMENLRPDSLLNYSHRVVEQNPNINGCSITMEPNFFPDYGRNFSVYSLRGPDSIESVYEAPYDYYDKVWYKKAREKNEACWVDPHNDFNEGTLSSPVMIASYIQAWNIQHRDKKVKITRADITCRKDQVYPFRHPPPRSAPVIPEPPVFIVCYKQYLHLSVSFCISMHHLAVPVIRHQPAACHSLVLPLTPLMLTVSLPSSVRDSFSGISPIIFSLSQSIVMTSLLLSGTSSAFLTTPSWLQSLPSKGFIDPQIMSDLRMSTSFRVYGEISSDSSISTTPDIIPHQ